MSPKLSDQPGTQAAYPPAGAPAASASASPRVSAAEIPGYAAVAGAARTATASREGCDSSVDWTLDKLNF